LFYTVYFFLFHYDLLAIISISTSAPSGNSNTATQVLAGYGSVKYSSYTLFISEKCFIPVKNTFTLTTSSELRLADFKTLNKESKHSLVCSPIFKSLSSFPVTFFAVCPAKNT